jgi:hypothetical protein
MALLRAAVATLLLAGGLVLFTPAGPVAACSCASERLEDQIATRDVIFRGTVVDRTDRGAGSYDYTFDVSEVFRGRAGARTVVRAASDVAVCGLEGVEMGEDFLVFAYAGKQPDEGLSTGVCSGTQETSGHVLRKVEEIAGPGRAPSGVTPRNGSEAPADPFIPYWAMVAVAGGTVGLLGVLLAWRRQTRPIANAAAKPSEAISPE